MPAPWNRAGLKNAASPLASGSCTWCAVEVVGELRPVAGEVARRVLLRVRQVHRRAGLDRHVAVGDRALQGQHRREPVHVRRVGRRLVERHEAEVVVAVRDLRRAARVDDVDLRGDLVAGPSQASQTSARMSLA